MAVSAILKANLKTSYVRLKIIRSIYIMRITIEGGKSIYCRGRENEMNMYCIVGIKVN